MFIFMSLLFLSYKKKMSSYRKTSPQKENSYSVWQIVQLCCEMTSTSYWGKNTNRERVVSRTT